jgi:hypothetical protein
MDKEIPEEQYHGHHRSQSKGIHPEEEEDLHINIALATDGDTLKFMMKNKVYSNAQH